MAKNAKGNTAPVSSKTTAPASSKTTAVTKSAKPAAALEAYRGDAGAGFEGADRASFAIPFLAILQSMSPQVKKSDGAYIKGAEEGMLYNTVSNEVYSGDDGVRIIPCAFTRSFVEWVPREKGGGLVAEYDVTVGEGLRARCKRDEKNHDILPNGNVLNDTRNHYLLVETDTDRWEPMMLSLTSTQIKASRNWMSAMQRECLAEKVPMFALVYRMTTTPQQNEKGSWYGAVFDHEGYVEDPTVYEQAKAFYEQARAGKVKIQDRGEVGQEAPSDGDDDPSSM